MHMFAGGLKCQNLGIRIGYLAGGVYTNVDDVIMVVRRTINPEHFIETGYPVGFGRRHLKDFGNMVEAPWRDPARLCLQRVKSRQQEVATFVLALGSASNQPLIKLDLNRLSAEASQSSIYGGSLIGSGTIFGQVQISH